MSLSTGERVVRLTRTLDNQSRSYMVGSLTAIALHTWSCKLDHMQPLERSSMSDLVISIKHVLGDLLTGCCLWDLQLQEGEVLILGI